MGVGPINMLVLIVFIALLSADPREGLKGLVQEHGHPDLRAIANKTFHPERSQLLLIKGKQAWQDAEYECWNHGYRLAKLDQEAARLALSKLNAIGIKSAWFGKLADKKKKGAFVLKSKAHGKVAVYRLSPMQAARNHIRLPILCQLDLKKGEADRVFREDDRRVRCSKRKAICWLQDGKNKCRKLCPIGHDIRGDAPPGIGHGLETWRIHGIKQRDPDSDSD